MQKLLEKEEAIMKLSNRYYELVPRATSKWYYIIRGLLMLIIDCCWK